MRDRGRTRLAIATALAVAAHVAALWTLSKSGTMTVARGREEVRIVVVNAPETRPPPPLPSLLPPDPVRRETMRAIARDAPATTRDDASAETVPSVPDGTASSSDVVTEGDPAIDLAPRRVPQPSSDAIARVVDESERERARTARESADAGVAGPRQVVIVDGATGVAQVARDWLGKVADNLDGMKLAETTIEHGPGTLVLTKRADGTFLYEAERFTATIHKDGRVEIDDKLSVMALPGPLVGNGKTMAQNQTGGLDHVLPKSAIDRRPPRGSDEGDPWFGLPAISGTFDANEVLLRAAGSDPYASEKSCFLDETLELRVEFRRKHRLDAVDVAFAAIIEGSGSISEKKRAVLELWGSCMSDEDGDTRSRVVELVRVRMPLGSALAFTVDDLATFNEGRAAHERFTPYG